MKALIVDDSRTTRAVLKRILEAVGFDDFIEAANGREALARLTAGPVDLALVDWNMPEMNGLELVQAARARADLADMPIMMITTETSLEQVASALEAGANEYLMKPFSVAAVEEKLQLLGIRAGAV